MPLPSHVSEITPEELVQRVESGHAVRVLDVRAPARLATGRIEIVPDDRFHNIVGSQVINKRRPEEIGLPKDAPVAVVCGRGNDSRVVANFLQELGYDASSLQGGMQRWMRTVVPRDLATPSSLDRFVQFDRLGKAALGYLLVSDGQALIVDPPRHVDSYRDALRAAGARLVAVADTHVHADYISGAPSLARDHGVPYHLHPADNVYPYDGTPGRLEFQPVSDESTLRIGRATVRVMHTPGHTEGSVTYLVDDTVALTGDFIFIASIGRPDLAGKTEEWTHALWQSVERAKKAWPATMTILPAHYASEKERAQDRSVARGFGAILEANEPLQMADESAFRSWVMSKKGSFPEAYRRIKAINVGLESVDDEEAEMLEAGKNECALG